MRRVAGIGRSLKRLVRARDGAIAVEMALVTPILVALFVPIADIGMGTFAQMQVQDAAEAGAQYAMLHGWNQTSIQNAVTNATSYGGIKATPTPAQTYGCATASGITSASQGATCADNTTAGTYVTVSAQGSYSTFINYPFLSSPMTLSASTTVRIQ